ncbi:MAG: hypothetical protein P8O85_07980 [Yoonia sp.]|nr:hypothetical protein [Yoonia sp.]
MDIVNNIWFAIGEFFWNMNSRLAVLYLASTVFIAFVIWLSKERPDTFLKWLIPAAVYRHKSNLLDTKIFLFNSVLMLGGFLRWSALPRWSQSACWIFSWASAAKPMRLQNSHYCTAQSRR